MTVFLTHVHPRRQPGDDGAVDAGDAGAVDAGDDGAVDAGNESGRVW